MKQGDTIRVDGASPRGSRARGREDQGVVRRSRRLDNCERVREHLNAFQVSSNTTDNCVEPTISQSIVVKRKLSQSEVDRTVQEAEKSRDEDEVNESKHEAESGLEKFLLVV